MVLFNGSLQDGAPKFTILVSSSHFSGVLNKRGNRSESPGMDFLIIIPLFFG